ncbi:MAG: hypothetical protein HY328_18945 [Chloroflexi bacterium]|nr:hypothetical protein [Chloroflexota bacterium]
MTPEEELFRSMEATALPPEGNALDQRNVRRFFLTRRDVILAPFTFLAGLGAGYLLWQSRPAQSQQPAVVAPVVIAEPVSAVPTATPVTAPTPVRLPDSYALPVVFGDIGPRLIAAGAIDLPRFLQVYQQAGQPLTSAQQASLTEGSDAQIVITQENAYFLQNFFWAVGLTNQNAVLTEGSMAGNSAGRIDRFASTGGWTLTTKPVTELYASVPLVSLTPEQQTRLEETASAVYRPCCDNPTTFPDCNHGMAMLGLLELMAAQDASADDLIEAAKFANAFWFPQQMHEVATLLRVTEGIGYADADARLIVSSNYASSSGFQSIHRWLVDSGNLGQSDSDGNNCGV